MILYRLHDWASKLCSFKLPNGEQPLYKLMQSRSLRWWTEVRDAYASLDPLNHMCWRHRQSGTPPVAWEPTLVLGHGLDWWDAAYKGKQEWKMTSRQFVRKLCLEW
eukprot:11150069-Karenia_brevis.AAC.1